MAKRKSATGWIVYRPETDDGFINYVEYTAVRDLYPSRKAALDAATRPGDKGWQDGLLKNGYRVHRVRVTVTHL